MSSLQRFGIVSILFISFGAGDLAADHPQYMLLQTPAFAPQEVQHTDPPTYGFGTTRQPYAYGWFGVSPRRHWSRHFGYYRNYTEWSAK